MKIELPSYAKQIISRLNENGFEAFAVGGCVRDAVIGKAPKDWDITTSALPAQVKEVFGDSTVALTGIKHGTVTVVYQNIPVEVTTYRIDGEYSDNRHPEEVCFTASLEEDLKRRDFTMNTICCNACGEVTDLFDGAGDIKRGLIRAVGNPEKRFCEDALRIMRAIRFSSVLGFEIEEETANAVHKCKSLLKNISSERIASELNKLLTGDYIENVLTKFPDVLFEIIPELHPEYNFAQHNPHHKYDVWTHTVKAVSSSENNLYLRLALLFHDIGKPHTFSVGADGVGHFYGHAAKSTEIARTVLNRLKYDNRTKNTVLALVKYHDLQIIPEPKYVKRFISKAGEETFLLLLKVKYGDICGQGTFIDDKRRALEDLLAVYNEIKKNDECLSLKTLAVNGRDLIEAGITDGILIGRVLDELLKEVINGKLDNKKDSLLKFAKSLVK